jgi:hypothetical protein
MRRPLLAALAALFAAAALSAGSLFVLKLKSGARVFALDRPVEKGHVLVFHRHPDGVFTSIPADEVEKIAPTSSADRTEKFAPGELMVLGRDVEGPTPERAAPAPPAPNRPAYYPPDYHYGMYWGFGPGFGHRHRPMRPPIDNLRVPALVGPNGFPIIAPPGSPGSTPLPIGPNGFPMIPPLPPR